MAACSLLISWIWFTAELSAQVELARKEEKRARDQERIARENQRTAEQQKERSELLLYHCVQAIVDQSKAVVDSKIEMQRIGQPGTILFRMAQFFAKKSAAYRTDTELSVEDREKLTELCAGLAIDFLENAWKTRYFTSSRNLQELAGDRTLDAIRTLPKFRDLVARIEAKPGGE